MGRLAEISAAYQAGAYSPEEYLKAFALQIARVVTDAEADEIRSVAEMLSSQTEE